MPASHEYHDTDTATRMTLDRVDAARRQYFTVFLAAAALEGVGLGTFLLLADLSNRTHVLILVAAVLTYGTIGLGLCALGVYTRWWALRIVQAIEAEGPR